MIEMTYSRPALEEYGAALTEYKAAQTMFDQAEPDRVDEAVYRLRAAELRLGAAIRALKEVSRPCRESNASASAAT